MPREIVTITHGSGGIRMTCDNVTRAWSNVEYLAESQAQSMLTERMRDRQFSEIRSTLNQAEKIDTVTAANLIAAIRKILDEDVPF